MWVISQRQCVYDHVSLALNSSKLQVFININSLKILSVDIHLPLTFIQTDLTWNDSIIVVRGRVTLDAYFTKFSHITSHHKTEELHNKYHSNTSAIPNILIKYSSMRLLRCFIDGYYLIRQQHCTTGTVLVSTVKTRLPLTDLPPGGDN